jgi:hypothetical protein
MTKVVLMQLRKEYQYRQRVQTQHLLPVRLYESSFYLRTREGTTRFAGSLQSRRRRTTLRS